MSYMSVLYGSGWDNSKAIMASAVSHC